MFGCGAARSAAAAVTPARGYHVVHSAVDGHSRLVDHELLADARKDTAAALWQRANAWFKRMWMQRTKCVDYNESCYRSHAFANASGIATPRPIGLRPTATAPWQMNAPKYGSTPATPNVAPNTPLAAHLQSSPWPHRTRGQPPTTRVVNLSGQYNWSPDAECRQSPPSCPWPCYAPLR
jgi:hypothetical protein